MIAPPFRGFARPRAGDGVAEFMNAGVQEGSSFQALAAVLDLGAAEGLHQRLLDACAHDAPVTLNGSAVERISTACAQVLAAGAISARARGLTFTLEAPSPALAAALADLGLAPVLLSGEPQ
jgi:anti-anti-sigma regulatory factor